MGTIINTQRPLINLTFKNKVKIASVLRRFFNVLEEGRYGYGPLLLVIIVCLGGGAAALAVQKGEVQLLAVAFSTMAVEVLLVAVASMRLVFWFSVVALLVDLFVFFF